MKYMVIDNYTNVLGTTPVFSGSRMPELILIEYLESRDRLDEYLENHQTVSRDQAMEVLVHAKRDIAGTTNEVVSCSLTRSPQRALPYAIRNSQVSGGV